MTLGFVFCALLAILPGSMNSCLKMPLEKFSEPCSTNNLIIISTAVPGNEIVCGASVPYTLLATQPNVHLVNFDRNQSEQSDFVLLAYDVTLNQLLWALSNIKLGDDNIVSQTDAKTTILKPYQAVTVDPLKKEHTLEFAIFERQPDFLVTAPVTVNQSSSASFNLYEWTSSQIKSGVKLCGPLGAAQITVHAEPQTSSENPSSTLLKQVKTQSHTASQPKANAKSSNSESNAVFYRPSLSSMFNSFYAKDDSFKQPAAAETKTPADSPKPALSDKKEASKQVPPKQSELSADKMEPAKPAQSPADTKVLPKLSESSPDKMEPDAKPAQSPADTKVLPKQSESSPDKMEPDAKPAQSPADTKVLPKQSESSPDKMEPDAKPAQSPADTKVLPKQSESSPDKMEPDAKPAQSPADTKVLPKQSESSPDKMEPDAKPAQSPADTKVLPKQSESSPDKMEPDAKPAQSPADTEVPLKQSESSADKMEPAKQSEPSDNKKQSTKPAGSSTNQIESLQKSGSLDENDLAAKQSETLADEKEAAKKPAASNDEVSRTQPKSSDDKYVISKKPESSGQKEQITTATENTSTDSNNVKQSNFGVNLQSNLAIIIIFVILSTLQMNFVH